MYFRQPRYYADFHCLGGACENNCCFGWRIDWDKEEVDKLKAVEHLMSPELRGLFKKTFAPNQELKGKYQVKFDERGRCPCVTDDGWCRIQRELGAEYLSRTCMVYPRNYRLINSTVYAYCNLSCPEVARKILNGSKAMDLVNLGIKGKLDVIGFGEERIRKKTELKFHYDIFEFFYELISDKNYLVEDSLILGALAAQSLTKLVEKKEFDRIPEALKSFRRQFHNPKQLKAIANIKPNYYAKLGLLGQLMKTICRILNNPSDNTAALTDSSGTFNIDLYNSGEETLRKHFENRPFAMRNIALNMLFELGLPFERIEFTIFENYSVYVTTFALCKLNAIASAEIEARASAELTRDYDLDKYLVKFLSMLSRALFQNNNNYDLVWRTLRDNKITSPAYLALLIK